jgi:hypothetical protein
VIDRVAGVGRLVPGRRGGHMDGAVGVVGLVNRFTSALRALAQDRPGTVFAQPFRKKSEKKQGRAFSALATSSSTSAVGPPPDYGSSYQRARDSQVLFPLLSWPVLRASVGQTGAPISTAESQEEAHPGVSSNPVGPTSCNIKSRRWLRMRRAACGLR